MVDLATTYGSLQLKNPLIVGAGSTTHTPEICGKAAQAGWAAVVLKTNWADECRGKIELLKEMRPQYALADTAGIWKFRPKPPKKSDPLYRGGKKRGRIPPDYAMLVGVPITREGAPAMPATYFMGRQAYPEYIRRTKQWCRDYDCKVIASIYAWTEQGWQDHCDMVNESDADAVELNLGCAYTGTIHPQTGQWRGEGCGMYPDLAAKWTKFCKERIKKIPVLTKLPPHCPDLMASAMACQKNGSEGIQYADGDIFRHYPIRPIMLDPETVQVGLFPGLPWATVSIGRTALPYILGGITLMKTRGITIDISGCSGVRDPLDIARYLMCGATSVQACTSTMVEGVGVGREYLSDFTTWMKRKGYKSVMDIVGLVLKDPNKLRADPTQWGTIDTPQILGGPIPTVTVKLNKRKCISCGWCEQCCLHSAIDIGEKYPRVDRKKCEVCGMCVAVCPVEALSVGRLCRNREQETDR